MALVIYFTIYDHGKSIRMLSLLYDVYQERPKNTKEKIFGDQLDFE